MNTRGQSSRSDDPVEIADETDMLHALMADNLEPVPLPAERSADLRARLMQRVAHSADDHRKLRATRLRDLRWQQLGRGVRVCVLHDSGTSRSVLMEFEAGASLPSHRHATHEECIVLRGSLDAGDFHVGLHDYHFAPAGSRHSASRSTTGGIAFLRGTSIGRGHHMARELISAWLPGRGEPPHTIHPSDEGWRDAGRGAQIKLLWQPTPTSQPVTRASMLVRLHAGAELPACVEAMDEECMLLEGEAFFGDLLLSSGEYLMAPTGARRGTICSERGALLFVHGDARPLYA